MQWGEAVLPQYGYLYLNPVKLTVHCVDYPHEDAIKWSKSEYHKSVCPNSRDLKCETLKVMIRISGQLKYSTVPTEFNTGRKPLVTDGCTFIILYSLKDHVVNRLSKN